jgi:hypothetical protein
MFGVYRCVDRNRQNGLSARHVFSLATWYFSANQVRAGCDTAPFMVLAVVLDLCVMHDIISEFRKLQLSRKP